VQYLIFFLLHPFSRSAVSPWPRFARFRLSIFSLCFYVYVLTTTCSFNNNNNNNNTGQRNLAIGGIAERCELHGFDFQISPFSGGPGSLSNTMLFGTTRVSLPNGISFCLTALAYCTCMTDMHSHIQTGHGIQERPLQ